jgi:hypothetical protein
MQKISLAIVALLASAPLVMMDAPARAQQMTPGGDMSSGPAMGIGFGGPKRKDADTIEREKKIDDDYKAVTRSIPEQKTSTDPWGNIRGNETPAQTTAAKRKRP